MEILAIDWLEFILKPFSTDISSIINYYLESVIFLILIPSKKKKIQIRYFSFLFFYCTKINYFDSNTQIRKNKFGRSQQFIHKYSDFLWRSLQDINNQISIEEIVLTIKWNSLFI